jgi:glycosyltransferase involved in cell wall biosynthesis
VALAERIEALLDDRELAEDMGRRARARFLDEFTIEVFRRNMEAVIASVACPAATSVR